MASDPRLNSRHFPTADVLRCPERLEALRRTTLLDTAAEESFDRLTRLAARILNVPVALVSFIDEDRQFLKSCLGLPEPWSSKRKLPLSHSFCQDVVTSGETLVIEDAHEHPWGSDNLAIRGIEVVAYAGIPLVTDDGHVLGSFCVIDHEPRRWTEEEVQILSDLAASVMTELELRTTQAHPAKRVDEETEESGYWGRYFRALVNASPNAIFAKDPEGRFTVGNPTMAGLYGLQPEDLIGRTDANLDIADDQVKWFREADQRVLQTGETVDLPALPLTAPGTEQQRWFKTRKVPLSTPDGGQQVLGIATEVSDLKEAEEALQRSERRFRALIEHGHDLIALLDSEGGFRYVSPSTARLLGYAPAELEGRSAFGLIHPDDVSRALEAFGRASQTPGQPQSVECRFRHQDGTWRWLEMARKQRPHLILLELNLPDLSGEEVLRALQEEEGTRGIPVVMISGDVLPQQIARLRALGAVEYLTKPFRVPDFVEVIDGMLAREDLD